jgi:hypothetical protein
MLSPGAIARYCNAAKPAFQALNPENKAVKPKA